jgi:hypothetical protein
MRCARSSQGSIVQTTENPAASPGISKLNPRRRSHSLFTNRRLRRGPASAQHAVPTPTSTAPRAREGLKTPSGRWWTAKPRPTEPLGPTCRWPGHGQRLPCDPRHWQLSAVCSHCRGPLGIRRFSMKRAFGPHQRERVALAAGLCNGTCASSLWGDRRSTYDRVGSTAERGYE